MLYSVKKIPIPLNYQIFLLVLVASDQPLSLYAISPLITKPPIPEEISDNSME
jgi:hypothetical protein